MGGVSSNSPDGLNVELNLVPFIDLLSSLVLFLLITAVWIQISAVPASVETAGRKSVAPVTPPAERLTIHLTSKAQELAWPKGVPKQWPTVLPRVDKKLNLEKLTNILKSVMETNPIASAGVSAEDNVDYGEVVETIDAIKNGGITSVAISSN